MDDFLAVQQRLVPDLVEKMYRRFNILSTIHSLEPVGRRTLSERLLLTERVLRTEVDSLKAARLINIQSTGMTVTDEGREVIALMADHMDSYGLLKAMSDQIESSCGIKRAIVVKGNADDSEDTNEHLGIEASKALSRLFVPDIGVTVTGGSTTANLARHLQPVPFNVNFTPARGGLGNNVTQQANVIVSTMAEQTGGTHQVLYVSDQVSESTYDNLMKEPVVMDVINAIKAAEIVVHGIGDALTMARRRHACDEVLQLLESEGAVGEAFGYYFDKSGNIVYKVRTIGLQLEDLDNKQHIIAVAGGASKAEAIKAYLKIAPEQTILITDEAVATQLLKG